MDLETARRFEEMIRRDGRYPPEAYEFLHRGLEHATRMVYGEKSPGEPGRASQQFGEGYQQADEPRHVTGQQLCEGLRQLAIKEWGPLAQAVLARWRIRGTRDFGEMVFLLVRLHFLGKQDSDHIENFDDVYDFNEAFGSYEITLDSGNDLSEADS
ncbi:MAG: hypothetical protein KKB50_05065 [Planctomycetes bacterium]|nr:hypothetical protein [Planctomycetota bacterium]